jgi:hypothetical protein
MNRFGRASFLPEKLDHRSLLEFAHLALDDVTDSSHMIKGDEQGGTEETVNTIHKRMKLGMCSFLSVRFVDFLHRLGGDYKDL